ncbi:MAG: 5-(carboxyamino)imidazole ribonucleotide synthase [Candidatus Tokpelaia sp. JSC085]|nr:MAG: 5-(carboxyamino)imidazole ribonucleotide synthase [Candidatus Tokpelaia sp. JSC085]
MKVLHIGATIGLIGGGQLASMMSIAAARLGFRTVVLSPEKNCSAARTTNEHIVAAYDNHAALEHLAQLCDVITYEFENIPITTLDYLALNTTVAPPPFALAVAQNRFIEKKFLGECGIATAPWWFIEDRETLDAALIACGGKGILKSCFFGYDGKGQVHITKNSEDTIRMALETIGHVPAILEGFVDFSKEISVIAARGRLKDVVFFDVPENIHQAGILRTSIVPAAVSPEVIKTAREITATILHTLNYIGVIAVEFFVKADGSIFANEFAPRVHNSGHWTEATCIISQFEQHIRAIAGWSLGIPLRHSDCIMENIIGDDINKTPEILQQPGTFIHLYGKEEIRLGRKMGHIIHITHTQE